MTRVYALVNQKGGVGKTTTAVNLSAYLATLGRRVLIVDADPQANASSSLGIDPTTVARSLYDCLIRHIPLLDVVLPTGQPNLDLVPSAPALAGAEVEMVSISAREHLLRRLFEPVLGRYDHVMIDCPPSLGLLTVNALTAASDGVIVPIQCEYLALEGLGRLWQTIQLVRESLNPRLFISGMVLTMFDSRTNLAGQVAGEVRKYFPDQVFRSVVPRSVRLGEAPSFGQTILAYAPQSAGALAYAALAEELLAREGSAGTGKGQASPVQASGAAAAPAQPANVRISTAGAGN
jgi:chromosome partitioning protein